MTDDEVLALLDHLDEQIAQVATPIAAALTALHEQVIELREQATDLEERQTSVAAAMAHRPAVSPGPALGELVVRVESAASARPPSTRKIERDEAGNITAIVEAPVSAAGPARWTPTQSSTARSITPTEDHEQGETTD